jgi:hypothetical protein
MALWLAKIAKGKSLHQIALAAGNRLSGGQAGFEPPVPRWRRREVSAGEISSPPRPKWMRSRNLPLSWRSRMSADHVLSMKDRTVQISASLRISL